jgi:hypothetical protein
MSGSLSHFRARRHRSTLDLAVVLGVREVALSNEGGLALLDAKGRKVHGISYTKEQAKALGWTLTFWDRVTGSGSGGSVFGWRCPASAGYADQPMSWLSEAHPDHREAPRARAVTWRGRASRGRWSGWFRRAVVQALAVFVLLFAAPGAADLVQQGIKQVSGVECCADGCDDCGEGGCPKSCNHCACCGHPSAVPATVHSVVVVATFEELTYRRAPERMVAQGYRAPPFRPPLG